MNRYGHTVIAVALSAAITLLFSTFPRSITAQDGEIQKLSQRISKLEERVMELETLLTVCKDPEFNAFVSTKGCYDIKNWRILKTGMTAEQVQAILGQPVKIIEGVRTLWYYPNIYCGYVSFDPEGHLTVWKEP